MLCDTPTSKGKQCRIPVDPNLHPTSCHVHMPNGNYQNKLKNKRVYTKMMTLSEDEINIIRTYRDIVR